MALQACRQAKAALAPAGRVTLKRQGSRGAAAQTKQAFYQENFALMYRFVLNNVGDREEAEDTVCEECVGATVGRPRRLALTP